MPETLRLTEPPPPGLLPSSAAPDPGDRARLAGSETVLLVDDDPTVRRTCGRILGRFGYRVLLAEDGLEAAALLETQGRAIHLVITDMVMPRMDARELILLVRRRWPALPVVLSTGYDMGRLSPAEAELFDQLVPKPYTPDEMLGAVRRALDGRRA